MVFLILLIMFEEAMDLKSTDFSVDSRTALRNYIQTWEIPIKFGILLVVYVILIPTLGFFTGSAVFMLSRSHRVRGSVCLDVV